MPGSKSTKAPRKGGAESGQEPRPDRQHRPLADVPGVYGGSKFIARGVRLVYEDEDVIVIDKPTGIVTADPARAQNAPRHMTPSAREGATLFDVVKQFVKRRPNRRKRDDNDDGSRDRVGRVWVIHRLDKEASGLLVFARSERAFHALKDQFASKLAHRQYMALAEGTLGPQGLTGTQESMIDEDREQTARAPHFSQRPDSESQKLAVTHYRVLAAGNDRTLVQVRLDTGRKNQIRVHMQEMGHSLVGDSRFGARTNPINRLGLHAAELGFEHPDGKRMMRFSSPAPASFYKAVGIPAPDGSEGLGTLESAAPQTLAQRPTSVREEARESAKAAADTSWNEVAGWYDEMLEDRGNDHYEQVILPGTLALLQAKPGQRVLDVACGQGILCRRLTDMQVDVTGVDAAPQLIEAARKRSPAIAFHVGDARKLEALQLPTNFDAVTCIMALSNIEPLGPALAGMCRAIKTGGTLVAVITHPAFRAPGESHWGWDDKQHRQYRRVDQYLTAFAKGIDMHPGKKIHGQRGGDAQTPTFHRPLGEYVRLLSEAGFAVVQLQEWISKRAASSGPRAQEENRARVEIPLFLGIRAVKIGS